MVKSLEGKTCKEYLRSFALSSLEKRRGCTFLQGGRRRQWRGGCWFPPSGDQCQDTMKWNQDAPGEVQMGHGENVQHREVVVPWKRLPREAVTYQTSRSLRRAWKKLSLYF